MATAASTTRTASNAKARTILRADKERNVITVDEQTSLAGVPAEAWDVPTGEQVGTWSGSLTSTRSASLATRRYSERFNTYRFVDHKEHVVDLARSSMRSQRVYYDHRERVSVSGPQLSRISSTAQPPRVIGEPHVVPAGLS